MIDNIDTIIFDLDGTLLDTLTDLMESVNYSLEKFGLPIQTKDDIRRNTGNGVEKLVELSVENGRKNPLFSDVLTCFKEHYLIHCNDKTGPYPGICQMLERLKNDGYKMAVVSNKYMDATKELVSIHFGQWIDIAIGANEVYKKKPAKDTVVAAINELGSELNKSIYVGDSEVDIATARNTGIPCIAVSWGFRTHEEQVEAGARVFAENPEEIMSDVKNETT
ncbi:MAG: HAD-IA family hydrolase [Eubacterium sp.]|nr:HAD-IA family hydrolase [Eubacterium sp.]